MDSSTHVVPTAVEAVSKHQGTSTGCMVRLLPCSQGFHEGLGLALATRALSDEACLEP